MELAILALQVSEIIIIILAIVIGILILTKLSPIIYNFVMELFKVDSRCTGFLKFTHAEKEEKKEKED